MAVRPLFHLIVVVLALASLPAHADAVSDMRRHLSMIHLLARAGRNEEAAAQMRALFPKGPPVGGELALEYYDIVGNSEKGWLEAKLGLERLVKADPENINYRLALATQLARRSATLKDGLSLFAEMAKRPDLKQVALGKWRHALDAIDQDAASIPLYKDYLAVDPGNAAISDDLATAQRIEAAKLPWKLRDRANAQIAAGHPLAAIATLRQALALDPKNPWVRFDLARLYYKQGDQKGGRAMMLAGLAISPNDPDLLYANALFLSLLDEPSGALQLLEKIPDPQLSPAMQRLKKEAAIQEKNLKKEALAGAQGNQSASSSLPWKLRSQADQEVKAGHPQDAIATLEHALVLDPKNVWVRFDLARLYVKQGDRERGRALMHDGLAIAPDDPAALYTNALYLSLQDEAENAMLLLDRIPESKRSQAMRKLAKEMTIQVQIGRARTFFQNGRQAEMQAAMASAETAASGNADLSDIVANAWFDLRHPDRGINLMRPYAMLPSASLTYAWMLNRARKDDELATFLEKLEASGALPTEDRDELWKLEMLLAKRRSDKMLASGNPAAAKAAMTKMLENTAPEDLEKRLEIADWYIGAKDLADARAIVEQSKKTAPFDPRILAMEGRIARAEGNYEVALADFKQSGADNEIADMMQHRAKAYVTTGQNYLSKRDGSPGIANMKASENVVEMHVPTGYDGEQLFVQLDRVSIDAGMLSLAGTGAYSLNQFGKLYSKTVGQSYSTQQQTLAGILASTPYAESSAQGTALGVGYIKGDMRFDIGTTPQGFPVSYMVGGVRYAHYTATSGFSFDVSRRPVTSTLLSYAGMHDPVTGEVWGGVRSTGASMHISRSKGRLTGSVDMDYHWITGVNVMSNTERTVRLGLDWSFIQNSDMQLNAGLAVSDWHYRDDLSNFTFGQGGYYSPQQYHALSLPLRWTGRENRLSYLVQGSVSVSTSYQRQDMPYYPTDPILQAQAGNPTSYTAGYGGDSHGMYYSIVGAVEYRATRHLYLGARLESDRTAYYSPNYYTAYLRYMFDPESGPVNYPPEPVKPYTQY